MPWKPSDAVWFTKLAKTRMLQALWAKVANKELEKHGDEGKAIRVANAVIKKRAEKRKGE